MLWDVHHTRMRAAGLVGAAAVAVLAPLIAGTVAVPATARVDRASASTALAALPPTPAVPHVAARIPVAPGCLVVGPSWAGVKVHLVQRRLGTTSERERYGPLTTAAVRRFQRTHGLPETGRVDATTWRRLGIREPFCIDRYTAQPAVPVTATSRARIEAMVAYATARTTLPYLWGAAGPLGFDCSGLVLQGLYAGGLVVPSVTTYLHQQRSFTTSVVLYGSAGLTRKPLAERRRGDLVFFGRSGRVSHVAIYLGSDRIVEAVRPRIRVSRLSRYPLPVMPLVVRPFR